MSTDPTAIPPAPKESYHVVTQTLQQRKPALSEKYTNAVTPQDLLDDRKYAADTPAELQRDRDSVLDPNDTEQEVREHSKLTGP